MALRLLCVLMMLGGGQLHSQSDYGAMLADSALTLTRDVVLYDPTYYRIDFPNGDVPADRGVCTDVVIRAYRKLGVDLQRLVHDDMKANFNSYPNHWGLSTPDRNIDHRRVPNLMTFFSRHGTVLTNAQQTDDFATGDIVCWSLGGSTTHIGIVSPIRSSDGSRYLVIHNIGAGQVAEDMLFDYRIIGHYRWNGRS